MTMKTIKLFSSTLLLFALGTVQSQVSKESPIVSVQDVGISVDKIEELESLDWNEIFSVFKENDPKDSIQIYVSVKNLGVRQKENTITSYTDLTITAKGISENYDELRNEINHKTAALIKYFKN